MPRFMGFVRMEEGVGTPPQALFDAFGSKEKTLHANLGGHTGIPPFEADASARFVVRHLT